MPTGQLLTIRGAAAAAGFDGCAGCAVASGLADSSGLLAGAGSGEGTVTELPPGWRGVGGGAVAEISL